MLGKLMENQATSINKIKELPNNVLFIASIGKRYNDLTKGGVVNVHPTERMHWVLYRKKNCFDPYGFLPPKLINILFIGKKHKCFPAEY